MRRPEKLERELLAKQLGEMGLIERILSNLTGTRSDRIVTGPGDDAAVIEFGEATRVVVTTDMLVEGVHFLLDWSYPEALGFKSVSANLSDVAAMGGQAVGIVISLGVPPAIPVRAVDGLYKGVSRALSMFGGSLLGGDTVRSSNIIISISAIGVLVGERPLLRSGANPGDRICVTGSLGSSRLGLALMGKYLRPSRKPRKVAIEAWADRSRSYFRKRLPSSLQKSGYACISKHLMPFPRMKEARLLSAFGPSAMIDISDGLSADLIQIANASQVGVLLREESLPIDRNARAVAQALGVSAQKMALSSGEEYELLFTVPVARLKQAASALLRRCGTSVEVIGEVTRDTGCLLIIGNSGRKRALKQTGFRHF